MGVDSTERTVSVQTHTVTVAHAQYSLTEATRLPAG